LNDLLRQKVLERCGWQFFRIRGGEYYSNRKKSLEPLWKLLRTNDIQLMESVAEIKQQKISQSEIKKQIIDSMHTIDVQSASNIPSKVPEQFEAEIPIEEPRINQEQNESGKIEMNKLFYFKILLVYTTFNNVYVIQRSGMKNKEQLISDIIFEEGEVPIFNTAINSYLGYLIVGFENGKIGKVSILNFQTEQNRKKIKNALSNESKLIFFEHIENDIDLVALSNIGKVVLFNTSIINLVRSTTTKGVQVMKQKNNSIMLKLKKLVHVKLQNPEYYRKEENLNIVGYYLKQGDKI
jgi:hypothetical protein